MEDKTIINTGNDSIVIVKYLEGIPKGVVLDATGFLPEVIQAGHVVIKDTNGQHKPMPVSGEAYGTMPTNHDVVGVVRASVLAKNKIAAVMVRGTVNEVASPYPVTSAIKTALPLIRFTQD